MAEYRSVKDSGARSKFATGAVRDLGTGKGRFDLLPVNALRRLAVHYENGALKYEDRNWEKGIPVHRMADSAICHILKALAGLTDEDHWAAAMWNIAGIVEFEERLEAGMTEYAPLFEGLGKLWDYNRGQLRPVKKPKAKR